MINDRLPRAIVPLTTRLRLDGIVTPLGAGILLRIYLFGLWLLPLGVVCALVYWLPFAEVAYAALLFLLVYMGFGLRVFGRQLSKQSALFSVLRLARDRVELDRQVAGALVDLSNVSVSYAIGDRSGARVRALDGVSLTIGPGEFVVVQGQNGAGKTTLLRAIADQLPDNAKFEGDRLVSAASPVLIENFEEALGADLTGSDWVRLRHPRKSDRETEGYVELVREFSALGDFMDLPMRTYSTGMKVRLAISAALLSHPRLIAIDEILAASDAPFLGKTLEKLQELRANGTSIIIVTHSELDTAITQKIVLNQGRIVPDGAASTKSVGGKIVPWRKAA